MAVINKSEIERQLTVYFDMDGVLTNFYGAMSRDTGVPAHELHNHTESVQKKYRMWGELKGWENTFFELPPNRLCLMKNLMMRIHSRGHKIEILTSLGSLETRDMRRGSEIHIGKQRWLTLHFCDLLMRGVIRQLNVVNRGSEKALYARPDTLLIDDNPSVVRDFRSGGGHAILYSRNSHDVCAWQIALATNLTEVKDSPLIYDEGR